MRGSLPDLDAARAEQARSAAALNVIREEVLRGKRIPIEIVIKTYDEVFQAIAAEIKAARNRKLTSPLINSLFDKLRAIPLKLNLNGD